MAVLLICKVRNRINTAFKSTTQPMKDVALCISPSCLVPCLPNHHKKFFHLAIPLFKELFQNTFMTSVAMKHVKVMAYL